MAVVSLLSLLCTSCIRFDVDLVVKADGTVSGSIIYAVSESLNSLDESDESISDVDGLLDESTPGVTVKPYDQGGYEGVQYFLEDVAFDEFKDNGESGELSFKRAGNEITMSGYLDLETSNNEGNAEESIFGEALAQSLLASGDIRIRVTFPAEVIATTGELSSDRRTVTWTPEIGDRIDLTTTVELPNSNLIVFVLIALGVLLIALMILWIKRFKKNNLMAQATLQS